MADDRRDHELEASTRKWMVAGLILMGLFVLAFPIFRFYEPAQRADARESQLGFFATEGAELFDTSCAECHGPAGSGAIAPAIGSKEFLESVDDDQIRQLTALGVPGTEMVAYSNDFGGPMTSSEIASITTYLRSLEEDAPSLPGWRAPLEDSDLTAEQLFGLACSRCHGVDRRGIEDTAPDISEHSMTMMETDEWIRLRIAEGYKGMPRFGRALSDEQIAAVTSFLRFGDDPPPATTTTTTTPEDGTDDTTPSGDEESPDDADVLALGEALYTKTFAVEGCQECHGLDMNGTSNGPSIIGASRSGIATALANVPDMEVDTRLTNEEIEAVYVYMTWLRAQD